MDVLLAEQRPEHALGRRGEAHAVDYLERLGLVVLSRNWQCRDGELDVVATDGRRVIVVEVKTRSGTGFGRPAEAITEDKAYRIRRLARAWLARYRVGRCEVRFDVVEVLWPRHGDPSVEHLRNAF